MILPNDDLYSNLKINSLTGDDDKMMHSISNKFQIGDYYDGELLDNNIDTVAQLFEFINRKRKEEISAKNKLFLK